MPDYANRPAPVAALFPARDERKRLDDYLTRELAAAADRVAAGSVTPTLDRESFARELAAFDFRTPRAASEVLPWVIAQMERGVVHMTHPRYFGLFNPAPAFPAQCADRIAASFNPQLAAAKTSPAAVAIEAHVIRAVALRAGLGADAGGHFTSGGSEANYTALLCALARANGQYMRDGVRSFSGQPVFYASRESHLAWVKIAQQAGIGRAALRMVATDGTGRMDMHALADAVGRDREQGLVPVMIAATAGTTSAGMIDPIGACVDIAREHGMWCHVDAAWAGGAIASDRLRGVLAGIEHADSVTIDAHKWLAATMGCGIFLTRHAALLSTTFNCAASYMPSSVVDLDPYMLTVQWSRRFLGLRLFLTLAAAGWEGYAAHVERSVAMSELLRETMLERGWSVVNASPVAVLSLEPPPGSAPIPAIVSQIVSSGGAWISVAKLEGRDVIRACMTHGETMPEDVLRLADLLATAASTAKG